VPPGMAGAGSEHQPTCGRLSAPSKELSPRRVEEGSAALGDLRTVWGPGRGRDDPVPHTPPGPARLGTGLEGACRQDRTRLRIAVLKR
jgi:hypothetical protein